MASRRKRGANTKSTQEPAPKKSRRDEKANSSRADSADEMAADGTEQEQESEEVGRWSFKHSYMHGYKWYMSKSHAGRSCGSS